MRISILKVALFVAGLLILFFYSRVMDKRASSTFSLTSASKQVLQKLLDQRGISHNGLTKKSLIDMANRTGTTWPEVHTMKLQMEAAAATTETILMSGEEYTRTLENRRSKVAWLVLVVMRTKTKTKKGKVYDVPWATPDGEEKWERLRQKMALVQVRTALLMLDCEVEAKWCKQRRWTFSRFHLSIHTGSYIKPDVIAYTSHVFSHPRLVRWVYQNLDHNVFRIPDKRLKWWLTVKTREIHAILLTDQPSPPPFFSALSIHFFATVSFAWVQIESRDEVAMLTDGLDLGLDLSEGRPVFPVILIATKGGVYRYGLREFECISHDHMKAFLHHLHPSNIFGMLFGLVIADILLASVGFFVYTQKFKKVLGQVFNDVMLYFVVTLIVWILVSLTSFYPPCSEFLVSLNRHFAMTSLGDLLRHDYVMLSGNPFRILLGLITSLLGLSLVPILRRIAQP